MRRTSTFLSVLLLLPLVVTAHTDNQTSTEPGFGLTAYLIVLAIISGVVASGLMLLRRFESRPGSLPIKKLSIAAGLTIAVNAIFIAVLYLEI